MSEPLKRKISMLGAYAVGKTSLVKRFVASVFDEKYHVTLGVKTDKKSMLIDGPAGAGPQAVDMMIWDVAGAEERFTVPSHYIKGSHGYLLVIDGTRKETLDRALDLAEQMDREVGPLPRVVLLNKADLTDRWRIDDAALAELAPLGCPILKSSAKTGENVDEAFHLLARRMIAPPV